VACALKWRAFKRGRLSPSSAHSAGWSQSKSLRPFCRPARTDCLSDRSRSMGCEPVVNACKRGRITRTRWQEVATDGQCERITSDRIGASPVTGAPKPRGTPEQSVPASSNRQPDKCHGHQARIRNRVKATSPKPRYLRSRIEHSGRLSCHSHHSSDQRTGSMGLVWARSRSIDLRHGPGKTAGTVAAQYRRPVGRA
jgi:hypothetical protein